MDFWFGFFVVRFFSFWGPFCSFSFLLGLSAGRSADALAWSVRLVCFCFGFVLALRCSTFFVLVPFGSGLIVFGLSDCSIWFSFRFGGSPAGRLRRRFFILFYFQIRVLPPSALRFPYISRGICAFLFRFGVLPPFSLASCSPAGRSADALAWSGSPAGR